MKKELKTELTKKRIIDGAIEEFGHHGYAFSTIDSICQANNLSKGIIYHNYQSKDQLYLLCVYRVFSELVEYINQHLDTSSSQPEEQLLSYLESRRAFFKENPLFLKIFCDALFSSPNHLENEINDIRQYFANKNIEIVHQLMQQINLRNDIPKEKIIHSFCQSFDLINVISHYKVNPDIAKETETNTLKFLLYGVVAR